MELQTLQQLYVAELGNLYSAEQQILDALPKLIDSASNADLKNALATHQRQTEGHLTRLNRIFEQLNEKPDGKKSIGLDGLVDETNKFIKKDPSPEILDAGIIAKAQKVEHYEMAAYGTVRTYAQLLGQDAQAQLLQQTLNEERQADQLLTDLAEHSVNLEAGAQPLSRDVASSSTRRTRASTSESEVRASRARSAGEDAAIGEPSDEVRRRSERRQR
ncbi:MAG TPA: ferritin-like domain-containing protein [Gemmatimonadaceae bacterium]|nr:ferritin-like domain-containing protein [Gemmatimonadaceae bacterium]